MTILVTGGCGFIGSHLIAALIAKGEDVRVIDDLSTGKRENLPSGAHFIEEDITTPGIFDTLLENVTGVFHLAAIASVERSRTDWYRTHQVNSSGFVLLLDAIARSGNKIPVVFASSAAVYGDCTDLPIAETAPLKPLSAYGVDKLSNELHARVATELHEIPTLGLRFFNVYGPNQDPHSPYSGVISIFMEKARNEEKITILGDGEQTRDFVFVEDVVQGLMAAMAQLQTGTVHHDICNLGTGNSVSIKELAQCVLEATGKNSHIHHGPAREGEIRFSLANISKAQSLLKFKPAHPLAAGLRKTYQSMSS